MQLVDGDLVARLTEAGVPPELQRYFSAAGLQALEEQRRESDARHHSLGSFERYCQVVMETYLAAKNLTAVAQ